MSSSASSRAAFRRRWRERLASSTPKTRVADGADILIVHGRSFCSRSPGCTQKALLLCGFLDLGLWLAYGYK